MFEIKKIRLDVKATVEAGEKKMRGKERKKKKRLGYGLRALQAPSLTAPSEAD